LGFAFSSLAPIADPVTDVLLNHVDGMMGSQGSINRIVPFAVEASWTTGRWDALQKYLDMYNGRDITEVFNLGIAHALLCLRNPHWFDNFPDDIRMLREKVAASLSYTATSSLQACHDAMLQAHVLTELEHLGRRRDADGEDPEQMMVGFSRRLEIIGASFANDKQYVLGIRRAAMELMRFVYRVQPFASRRLTCADPSMKADIFLACGLPPPTWPEKPAPCSSRSTRFFMLTSSATSRPPSTTRDYSGRKATTARPSRFWRTQYGMTTSSALVSEASPPRPAGIPTRQ